MEPQGAPLDLRIEIDDRTVRVHVAGELDLFTSDSLRRQLQELTAGDVDLVEIDATELSFVDSAGLHALVRARNEAEANGVAIRVGAMSDSLQQVLDMTNLRGLLTS